jgi:MoaA/NifB/PqqE/SkfB family radical SAM enzyme
MSKCNCILTDIGLATQTNGEISICNQSRTTFKLDNNTLRLNTHTLDLGWTSPTRQEIKDSLANGIRHKNCQDCWDEEDAGRPSLRILSNKKFKDVLPNPDQPRVFMIKPGNTCNLSCRHCNPYVSTGWYKDHYQTVVKPNSDVSFIEYLRTYSYIKDSYESTNPLWNTLKKWNHNIVYYDLYGAEPLLIAPLLELLRESASSGIAKEQSVHVNTNGTIWHDDFNQIFSSFKYVDIGISIDAFGPQAEYMRYPASWEHLLDNLEKYKNLSKTHSGIDVSVCVTLSLLNIYYLPEYIQGFHSMGVTVGLNVVHRPDYLNMRIAPHNVKKIIADKLTKTKYPKGWDTKVNELVNFLMLDYENSDELLQEFWNYTNSYDLSRNQKYKEIFPEFYKILIKNNSR